MTDYWFVLAVGSALFNGLRGFYSRVAVGAEMAPAAARMLPPATMVILALPFMWRVDSTSAAPSMELMLSAGLQGALFYVGTISRLEALRVELPTHILYPIAQASTPLIVLLSGVLFGEWTTLLQPLMLTGIVASILAVYVLADWRNVDFTLRQGVGLAFVAMLASTGATLAAKFALDRSERANVFAFILVSNLMGVFLAGVQSYPERRAAFRRVDWIWGLLLGGLNFLGLTLFLEAIKWGDLSLVASVGALSLLVPIVLGALLHHDALTLKQHVAVCCSLLALLLFAKK